LPSNEHLDTFGAFKCMIAGSTSTNRTVERAQRSQLTEELFVLEETIVNALQI
jgi:hypothetical protein